MSQLHRLKKTFLFLFVFGWLLILGCLYCGHTGISHPFSWPKWKNMCYFSLVRAAFTGGVALQLMAVFLGHMRMFTMGMQNPVICAFAKGMYPISLCYPILIAFIYNSSIGDEQPIYISLYVVIYLGMGDIMVDLIFGVAAYSLLEWPVQRGL